MKFSDCYYILNLKEKNKDAYWVDNKISILNFEPYSLNSNINWLDDPHNHRSWRWLLNNFKWADTLIYAYIYKNNINAIELAVEYFFNWYRFYITEQRVGEFLWKDDAVSFRAFRFSAIIAYIIESDHYSADQKNNAINALNLHYEELINPDKFKMNNHGVFQIRALLTLTNMHNTILDESRAEKYAAIRLNELWLKQYGFEGVHLENSTAYHQIIIREFKEILQSQEFRRCNLIFNNSDIEMVMENTKYFYHPNGSATLFGDSNLSKKPISNYQEEKHFKEAGYVFKRKACKAKGDSYIAIRTGFPSNIHRHSDDFSFEWSEDSQIILQDSGRYSYDYDDSFRIYITSTRAHNTVTVNGTNFPWWGRFDKKDFYKSAIREMSSNEEQFSAKLNMNFREPNIFFEREFNLIHGQSLEVTDYIESKDDCSVEQWFHLSEDFEYIGTSSNNGHLFNCAKMLIEVKNTGATTHEVVKGRLTPSIQGWVSYSERTKIPRWSIGFFKNNTINTNFNTIFRILEKTT